MHQSDIWNERFAKGALKNKEPSWLADYLPWLHSIKDYPVVDLGCGKGQHALFLHNQGFDVTACDFSQVAISQINQQNPSIVTHCFDMTCGLPQDLHGTGAVIASLSLHYFSLETTREVIQSIADCLIDGGIFLLQVNAMGEYDHNDSVQTAKLIEKDYYLLNDGTTKRYFTPGSLRALLDDAFEVIELKEICCEYNGKNKYLLMCLARKK